MVQPTKRNVQLAAAFLDIANRFTCPGWIEFLLWETIEGARDRPFKLMEPLEEQDMATLRACRDEAGLWFAWQNSKWNPVPIDQWRKVAKGIRADQILDQMHMEANAR